MARDGTCGVQITLYAAVNLYKIDIQIVSSLGNGEQHVFSQLASVLALTFAPWRADNAVFSPSASVSALKFALRRTDNAVWSCKLVQHRHPNSVFSRKW